MRLHLWLKDHRPTLEKLILKLGTLRSDISQNQSWKLIDRVPICRIQCQVQSIHLLVKNLYLAYALGETKGRGTG